MCLQIGHLGFTCLHDVGICAWLAQPASCRRHQRSGALVGVWVSGLLLRSTSPALCDPKIGQQTRKVLRRTCVI